MNLKPSNQLSELEIQSGLKYVTRDGLFTEAMVAFTGGTFLVAMAMQMGASNFQLGLLAALPTLCNVLQLSSIWMVHKFRNRRVISAVCSTLARFPLIIIALLPFIFSTTTSVNALIFLLFFHYAFGSISGAVWNSWMKDLVPQEKLGSYFSYRTRVTQITNVVLSIVIAMALDYIKLHYPAYSTIAYPVMFLIGGFFGIVSVWMITRTPEPTGQFQQGNILGMMRKPLADKNFRKLLFFNSSWLFSLNLATPFFSVYLLKSLDINLSTIIILNIIQQVSSILFLRVWGKYSDTFSNKTVIRICAPIYVLCLFGWAMVTKNAFTLPLLVIIHIVSGMTTGGINLAITNIGLKLAKHDEAIVYIAARNMVNAFVPALAPMIGGIVADHFSWHYFFITSGALAFISLRFLKQVNEEGELSKGVMIHRIVSSLHPKALRKELTIISLQFVPGIFKKKQ
ncbi:MAG: MFS transporter [Chitinophagaceae bacterium]|nr:MFS transporter [Chitinophagaceae bacterium]